jgi:Ca2+-binding EF-hand superfamily protein
MKRRVAFAVIAAVSAAAFAVPVLAQEAHHHGYNHGERMLRHLDLNGDGGISPAEARAIGEVRFLRMDSDGDGVITEVEMQAAAQKRIARRIAKKIAWLDKNGDGRVERAEFDEHGAARFARLDTDGDGRVSQEEFRARPHGSRRGWHDGKLPDE